MSAVRSLTGGKRTSRGRPISVAIDPDRTLATTTYILFDRPQRLPDVEFGQLHCRILVSGEGHAASGVYRGTRQCCGLAACSACPATVASADRFYGCRTFCESRHPS